MLFTNFLKTTLVKIHALKKLFPYNSADLRRFHEALCYQERGRSIEQLTVGFVKDFAPCSVYTCRKRMAVTLTGIK